MKKQLEDNIRELSEIFAYNVNALRNKPLNDMTAEEEQKMVTGTYRAYELEPALKTELNISEDADFYGELIKFAKKEGSDATKAMEGVLPFHRAFMENLRNMGIPKGTCQTGAITEEALEKTRQQFDAPSGP